MPFKSKHFLSIAAIITIILSVLSLSACGSRDAQEETVQNAMPTIEVPTATPLPPDRALLVTSPDTDATLLAEAQAVMTELCASSGLEFETRQSLTPEEVTGDVKLVYFLQQPDNLGSLAANAPGTQFAAVTDQDWNPTANVTIVRTRSNDVAFLSGYIAAMLAPNYRVGALLAAEDTNFNQAFQNGVYYYCGICASVIYPLYTYPFISSKPAASTPDVWQAGFDEINANKINVLYLANEANSAQLASYLSAVDVAVIGSQAPLAEGQSRWAGSIYVDTLSPIREIWNDMLAGTGGKTVNAALKVEHIQEIALQEGSVWISPGKLMLVDKMIELLREDQINTLTVY
jgi:hypothetical protein